MCKWIGIVILIFLFILNNNNSDAKQSSKPTYRSSSTNSASSMQILTSEEKRIVEFLQKNQPEALKKARKQGYSDKQIARYVIEHADDEEE